MKKLQVDRFEEDFAVLVDDDDMPIDVLRDLFGFELHEGDILAVEFDGDTPVSAVFLEEETLAVKARVEALRRRLREKAKRK